MDRDGLFVLIGILSTSLILAFVGAVFKCKQEVVRFRVARRLARAFPGLYGVAVPYELTPLYEYALNVHDLPEPAPEAAERVRDLDLPRQNIPGLMGSNAQFSIE
jgi:hypothetical protein